MFSHQTPDAYLKLAVSRIQTDPAGAVAALDEGLTRYPDDAELLQAKAVFASQFGMTDVVLEASKNWAESTNATDAWYARGRALQDSGRNEDAIEAYRRAVDVDAKNSDAWINLGSLLDDRHEHAAAIEAYDRALVETPKDEVAWSNKGNSLLALGRFDEAATCFAAVDQVPWQRRALAYAGRLDEVQALQHKAPPAQGELRQQTRAVGERRLVARYFVGAHTNPELLDHEVGELLDFAVSRVSVGRGLADGVTLLYHWMVVTIRERGADLVLCEPISGADETRVGDELTFTAFAAVQLFAQHASLGCEPEPCTAVQGVSLQIGAQGSQMVALREAPRDENDSGWRVVSELEPDGEIVELTVLRIFASLLPAGLATLPVGWRIELEDWNVARILDAEGVVRQGPALDT